MMRSANPVVKFAFLATGSLVWFGNNLFYPHQSEAANIAKIALAIIGSEVFYGRRSSDDWLTAGSRSIFGIVIPISSFLSTVKKFRIGLIQTPIDLFYLAANGQSLLCRIRDVVAHFADRGSREDLRAAVIQMGVQREVDRMIQLAAILQPPIPRQPDRAMRSG